MSGREMEYMALSKEIAETERYIVALRDEDDTRGEAAFIREEETRKVARLRSELAQLAREDPTPQEVLV